MFHRSQPQPREDDDHSPANIEFEPTGREFSRGWVSVVIVVELFAPNPKSKAEERRGIVALVRRIVVPIAEKVPQTIDHKGCPKGNPEGVSKSDQTARKNTKECHGCERAERNSKRGMSRIEISFDPIVRRASTIAFERLLVSRLPHVLADEEKDLPPALSHRRMWIAVPIGIDMVLPVDCDPLLGLHPRREPQPETHEMRHYGMKCYRPVSL